MEVQYHWIAVPEHIEHLRLFPSSALGLVAEAEAKKGRALMAYLCRLICPPGGTVLDPFAGSGSTGLGALSEGLSFLGIEKDPTYCVQARARLLHHFGSSKLVSRYPADEGADEKV